MELKNGTGHTFKFTGLSKINVLLGKNGSGKSTLLKKISWALNNQNNVAVNYVTPERGGILHRQNNMDELLQNDPLMTSYKCRNQWSDFKNYTASKFKMLEHKTFRVLQEKQMLSEDKAYNFNLMTNKINELLANINIKISNVGDFDFVLKGTNQIVSANAISSGESEFISLAIECSSFAMTCDPDAKNLLLLDEPDVHLHPDLQANFMKLLIDLVDDNKSITIIIATHSTAILGALYNYKHSRFAILKNKSDTAEFHPIASHYQNVLPIFGAHPLSNLFNQNPIFLVEGEDDVRVFQQAIRTANGALKLYPCEVGGIGNMPKYEKAVTEIINGVYDNAIAFSLRDRDMGEENLTDIPPVIRFKTSCRSMENLILSDEVLINLKTTWTELETKIENWLNTPPDYTKFAMMKAFKDGGYSRKTFDIKEIRNVLMGLTPSNKSWEVVVGQTIGNLVKDSKKSNDFSDNKLCNYLGAKLVGMLRS